MISQSDFITASAGGEAILLAFTSDKKKLPPCKNGY